MKPVSSWMESFRRFAVRIESKLLVGGSRRLRLSVSGRMYIFLTIGVGFAAMLSNNNILYWIESLLLAGLILSGVLSEALVSGVRVDWKKRPAFATEPSGDWIEVRNESRLPLFCVEIGEWSEGEFTLIGFVPVLSPKQKATIAAIRVYPRRGEAKWESLAIQTGFPFGLAKKLKLIGNRGERLVYPARESGSRSLGSSPMRTPIEPLLDGSLRLLPPDEAPREVYWPKSLVTEQRFGRPRAKERDTLRLRLERAQIEDAFERELRRLSFSVWEAQRNDHDVLLEIFKRGRLETAARSADEALRALALARRHVETREAS